ncbi:predicted protein [Histoplasma capsulatum var. duboisii H88]|uniref:Predicted protein n=1 Tax=Ajellomyces capsulatus (strain H88) TaxID=544711 RepID=F0UGL1_AJEC8|nr:predicted protein [Histoplasma capsulatum var. duboisii H88]
MNPISAILRWSNTLTSVACCNECLISCAVCIKIYQEGDYDKIMPLKWIQKYKNCWLNSSKKELNVSEKELNLIKKDNGVKMWKLKQEAKEDDMRKSNNDVKKQKL